MIALYIILLFNTARIKQLNILTPILLENIPYKTDLLILSNNFFRNKHTFRHLN